MKIVLRLDPKSLDNPDLDIRYSLPDVIEERSKGDITDDGYDYSEDARYLLLFLEAHKEDSSVALVRDVIENERILDNDLRPAVVVAIEREGDYEVVYPPGFAGPFLPKPR